MLLLLAPAFAGVLGVTTSAPAVIRVDGEAVPMFDGAPGWMELAGDRLHVIEARTTSDRPIATLETVVPDGIELLVEWRGRNFAVTSVRPARPTPPDQVATHGATVVVQFGPGASASAPPPVPVAATAPVVVELVPKDTEWSNVWIDGEKVAEFRVGDTKKTVVLAPGPHKVEVRDFMEDETWVSGTLVVTGPGPVKVGFAKGGAEVYTDPKAWTPGK